MFTYPVMSAGDAFYKEEWVVMSAKLSDGVSDKLFYWKSTESAVTIIATGVMPAQSFLACDGKYIITPSGTSAQHMGFYGWNGSTGFTAALHDFDGGDLIDRGIVLISSAEMAGKVIIPYTDSTAVSCFTYDPTTPTAFTQTHELSGLGALKGGYDLRSGIEKFTPTYGTKVFIAGAAFTSSTNKMLALTGTTLSDVATGPVGTSQALGVFPQQAGYDRDYHIAYHIVSGTVYAWVMDVDTPSIGERLTLTGMGSPSAITGVNGFVIIAEGTGLIKSYSRAGTVLTEVSSYDYGAIFGAGNGQLIVSPYTNWVYAHGTHLGGTMRVLKVSESGIITALGQLPPMSNVSGIHTGNWSFLSSALPDLS